MEANTITHKVDLVIVRTEFIERDEGVAIRVFVRVACRDFCDFTGKVVYLTDYKGDTFEMPITKFNKAENETEALIVYTAAEPGEYTWTASFSLEEEGGVVHAKSEDFFTYIHKPHAVSMAVWDFPNYLLPGASFNGKVGVKCSALCNLQDTAVELLDETGAVMAEAKMSGAPAPGTAALYWAELSLKAPDAAGVYTWQAKFLNAGTHSEASKPLILRVEAAPECSVTIALTDKESKEPLSGITFSLPPYQLVTDEAGEAKLDVAKGDYQLYITKNPLYKPVRTSVNIEDSRTVRVELEKALQLDQDF